MENATMFFQFKIYKDVALPYSIIILFIPLSIIIFNINLTNL